MDRIEKLCVEKGMRMTEQRRVIARVISTSHDHPDVEETDGGLLLYRFRDVPPGVYRAWICVGGRWAEVMRGVVTGVVRASGRGASSRAMPGGMLRVMSPPSRSDHTGSTKIVRPSTVLTKVGQSISVNAVPSPSPSRLREPA